MANRDKQDHPTNPRYYGVYLVTEAQRSTWKKLVRLDTMPSRYPHQEGLNALGIAEDFWSICHHGKGDGLSTIVRGNWPSYRKLTLEFLSTLTVEKTKRPTVVKTMEFRLGNRTFNFTLEEFSAIFKCYGDYLEPDEFDRTAFWHMITTQEEDQEYDPARAKSTSIRNPVLRYIHRICANLIFARHDSGGVTNTELFLLWNLVKGRAIDLGSYLILHLERCSMKTGGIICCGGVITAIAEHVGISTAEWVPDLGEMFCNIDVLKNMEFLKVDANYQGFFIQQAGDHFPVPNTRLSLIGGWENRYNWKMNEVAHMQAIAATPVKLPWKRSFPPRGVSHPPPSSGDSLALPPPPPPPEHQAAGSSESNPRRRRRRRPQNPDEFYDSMGTRMDNIETMVQEIRDDQHTLGHRLTDIQHQMGEANQQWSQQWAEVNNNMTTMLHMMQQWHPCPPPPPPQ